MVFFSLPLEFGGACDLFGQWNSRDVNSIRFELMPQEALHISVLTLGMLQSSLRTSLA